MSKVPHLALAVTLAAMAGWVDAVGFLHFARLFLSFMSGNSTKLAVEIGSGGWSGIVAPILAIAAFVFGSFLGALIAATAGAWRLPAVLATEAGLLTLSLTLPHAGGDLAPASVPVVIAMGVQNAALRQAGEITVGLTYVTGTLVKLGQSLADALLGRSGCWIWTIYAVMWLGLATGAIGGAVAYGRFGYSALIVPAVAFGLLAILAAARILQQRKFRIMLIVRISKVVMVAAIGLFASLVAFGNITDYTTNFAFVQHVLTMDTIFPDATIKYRAITNPVLHNAAYILIIAAETLTAILCWLGSFLMLCRLRSDAVSFNRAKGPAVAGLTLGFLVWQVGFMSIGGEWFGMWMSEQWNGVPDAFRFFITILAVLIFLLLRDEEFT